MTSLAEKATWKPVWKIERFENEEAFQANKPYDISVFEGNLLLNEGIDIIWTLVAGGTATAFDNTNAYIGVGDSTTAADATQTGLQATTNKVYLPMETGYPTYGSSQQIVFKSVADGTTANFSWQEFTVANGSDDTATNLNRKVSDQGTKASGQIWTVTLTISLS